MDSFPFLLSPFPRDGMFENRSAGNSSRTGFPSIPLVPDISGVPLVFARSEGDDAGKSSAREMISDDKEFVEHTVKDGETVQGLAIKYSVTTEDIRRLNKIPLSCNIPMSKTLLIPKGKVAPTIDKKSQRVRLMGLFPAMTQEEADYYLNDSNGDFARAVEIYKSDVDWEQSRVFKSGASGITPNPNSTSATLPHETAAQRQRRLNDLKRLKKQ